MNQRRHLAIIAAVATLLASAPLHALFTQWTWAIDCFIAVATVCAAGIAARSLRAPTWAQPIVTTVALLFVVTWLHASGQAFGGIIPSPVTFEHFRSLVVSAGDDMRNLGIPVIDRPGLLFLVTAGVGVCAVIVDFVAVTLRHPAVAGLPMLAIYAVPVAIDADSVSLVAFAAGAIGYMWLLVTDNVDRVRMFGRRFTGEGRGVDMWEPSPLAAIGRRTALVGVVLAILLPLVIPGLSHSLVGPIGPSIANNGGGLGNCVGCAGTRVDLFANLAGQLNNDKPQVLATVKTTASNPPYLRFAVADNLSDRGFSSSPPQGQPISQGLPNLPYTDVNGQIVKPGTYPISTASVQMGPLDMRFLPVFLAPVTGSMDSVGDSWRYDSDSSTIFTPTGSTQGLNYTFQFEQISYKPDDLRAAQPLPDNNPIQVNDTKLPSSQKLVNSTVKSQTTGLTSEYDKVRALYNFFSLRNGFSYSLSTKDDTGGSAIENFLTNRKGYCVQYAAALAWLVRAAHIPARVAFGFTNGSQTQPGVYSLTNRDLHAWTEVYFQDIGWVPFDATPSIGLTGAYHTAWQPDNNNLQIGNGQDPGDVLPTIGGSASAGATAPQKPDIGGLGVPGSGGGGGGTNFALWALLAVVIVVILAFTPAIARVLTRSRRETADKRVSADSAAPGEPFVIVDDDSTSRTTKQRVHAAWDEFIDTLVDYQVYVDPTETPRAAAERIATTLDLPPEAADGARTLGAAEERARYARRPGQSQPLHDAVRAIRRALGRRVSFRTRLRAELLPPSVMARWSANASALMLRTQSRVTAARESVLRVVNVRRWTRFGRKPQAE